MKTVRAGVVGVGHFGSYHAAKYAGNAQARLVAVADNDVARAAEVAGRHGARAEADYRALAGEVDAVSIAVPTRAHHEVARFFLDQGVHVLVEKPIASTPEQADDLIALARARGAVLQVGHLERFFLAETGLIDVIDRPLYIEAVRIAPFGPRGTDVSVVMDLMIHDIDLILALARSKVDRVDAIGAPVVTPHPDIVNTRIDFANGCVATITASRVSLQAKRRLRIFQPEGLISVDMLKRSFATVQKTGGGPITPGAPINPADFSVAERAFAAHDALEAEVASFVEAVRTGSRPLVTGEDGREALVVAGLIGASLEAHTEKVRKGVLAEPKRPVSMAGE